MMDSDRSVEINRHAGGQGEVIDPAAALDQEFVLPTASTTAEATGPAGTKSAGAKEDATLLRQSFQVGDLNLLCSRDASREVVEPPKLSRIPFTASWFLGMANIRGGLTPVVDLAAVLGVENNAKAAPYLLVFGSGNASMGLLIDGLPRGLTLKAGERLPNLPPLPEALKGYVHAAYKQDTGLWLDFEPEPFFESLAERISA